MKLIQYISTTYVREELYNPDNWDLINPKSPPEFISSGGPFCHKVELEGFEPSSKRGTNELSTCLSSPKLSGTDKTEATNPFLSPLKFHRRPGTNPRLFPISLHHLFGTLRNNSNRVMSCLPNY